VTANALQLIVLANQPVYTSVISTIEHFAKDITDFQTAKLAFSVLARMVLTWGGSGTEGSNGATPGQSPLPKLPGFNQFMMTTFSPLCWAVPSNPNFDPKDTQGKQVLGEAAALQKAIYTKTGQEYLTYLKDVELSGMGMDSVTVNEYLIALSHPDTKTFQQFFKVNPFRLMFLFKFTDFASEPCAKNQMIHLSALDGMGD